MTGMPSIGRIWRYLNEVKAEMAQVTWPSRSQTLRLTALVIAASIVLGLFTGALDYLFTEAFKLLVNK